MADRRNSTIAGCSRFTDVKLEDFNFINQLGSGTFGTVFLANLVGSKEQFAIKVIRKDVIIKHNQINAMFLEKEILFSANHPFLTGVDYVFQSKTRVYFVMPYIAGAELYKLVMKQRRKRFSEKIVKFYAAQIILGIGELHRKGIMHRDLKLENIMVDDKGFIKIIDFGLAKIVQPDEVATTFCGTRLYFAPEMIDLMGYDMAVDWWAVGIILYEMLIGSYPFFHKTRM